jgi:hypothetical protein
MPIERTTFSSVLDISGKKSLIKWSDSLVDEQSFTKFLENGYEQLIESAVRLQGGFIRILWKNTWETSTIEMFMSYMKI